MYFKAIFNPCLNEDAIESFDVDFDLKTGLEIISFNNHTFEITRNDFGNIEELRFCNECINTFDIEEAFIQLIWKLLSARNKVIMFDSDGSKVEMSKSDLEEFLN